MFLLRILRNLAALVIVTIGGLSVMSRPMAAQSSCQPLGGPCEAKSQCCSGLCGWRYSCCDKPFHGQYCVSYAECCSRSCVNHRCS